MHIVTARTLYYYKAIIENSNTNNTMESSDG